MEPADLYFVVTAVLGAGKTLAEADAQLAAEAKRLGISKSDAWAAVRMEARKRNDAALKSLLRGKDVGGSILDLADPMGWRSAAKELRRAERDQDPNGHP